MRVLRSFPVFLYCGRGAHFKEQRLQEGSFVRVARNDTEHRSAHQLVQRVRQRAQLLGEVVDIGGASEEAARGLAGLPQVFPDLLRSAMRNSPIV
jgi:hypothetical protein